LHGSASAPGFNQKDINLIIYSEAIPLSHALIAGVASKTELQRRDPQPVAVMPATMAGAYLCRRFYIHPEIADLVAALAGLGNRRIA
jgi:hypothetical protein